MTSQDIEQFVWGLCEEHGTACECFECGACCRDEHEPHCSIGIAEEAEAFAAFCDEREDEERSMPVEHTEKPWG